MASSPCWAATHKTHADDSASAAADDAPAKPAAAKARHTETLKTGDTAAAKKSARKVADDDGDTPRAKGATPERIKLADDDLPAKGKKASTKLADTEDGDDAPVRKTTSKKTTKLADADDTALVKGAVKAMHGKAAHDDADADAAASQEKTGKDKTGKETAAKETTGEGKKAVKLADAGDDGDAPPKTSALKTAVKGKKTHKDTDAADDGDDAPAKGKKTVHATKLADADDAKNAEDANDAPVKTKKGARAKADDAADDDKNAEDSGSDDATGFYKKVHGKLVLVSDTDVAKTRTVHHRLIAVDAGPFYHKIRGKAVRVTTIALASFRKAHRAAPDENALALAAAAHAMTTGTMMPAKLSVVAPMARMTQPHGTAPSAFSQALSQTAKAATTPLVTLTAVTDALSKLPQSLFNAPGTAPAAAMPPAATQAASDAQASSSSPAAPVPYTSLANASANSKGGLSPEDAALYRTAFSQIDSGDFDGAEASLALVSDKSLVGYAEYHKLANPDYQASYDDLTQWLTAYGDQPMAMRVWTMAKRKKPYGAPDPAYPSLMGDPTRSAARPAQTVATADADKAVLATATGTAIVGVALDAHTTLDAAPQNTSHMPGIDGGAPKIDTRDSDLTPKSARSAYNNGQYDMAVTLARKIGDHWVAGLANWRLKHYDAAEVEFKFVSTDPSRDAWGQSAGAYWAGRCADKLGQADEAQTFLKYAASFPFTFYGLMAEQKLGVTPAVVLAKHGQTPTFAPDTRQELTASLTDDFAWTHGNAQAQRLSALVQIGRVKDAQAEAQSAVQRAGDGTERDHWLALATYNHIEVSQLHATDRLFDATRYPAPTIKLKSGYAVDRALLFAFARKESKFNTKAKSFAGAYGLLQLMPGTAALLESNSRFNAHPDMLFTPAVNMRVGQEYMQRLLDSPVIGGDLIRMIAAYNGGPGPVKDALAQLGPDADDSVLLMESIPVAETRQYVEEVAANYWIYHQILGEPNKTLAMAANGNQVLVTGPAPTETKTVAEADEVHGSPGVAN